MDNINIMSKHYFNNSEVISEIILSRGIGKRTEKLERYLLKLVDELHKVYVSKNFNNISIDDLDDFKQDAILLILRYWVKFDETKYSNPMAFYQECLKRSYIYSYNKRFKTKDGNYFTTISFDSLYSF